MAQEPEWWKEFFSGLWLEVQRSARTGSTAVEADFLERHLELEPGNSVLDVPCGEGRLSLELASRRYRLVGVDRTEALLEDARASSRERGLEVVWHRRDMRDLPWEGEFDAAFCFWGSFGYFDDDGNRAFLEALGRVLRPGGRLALDVPNVLEGLLPSFQPRGWWEAGDILVVEERSWDLEASRIDVRWEMIRDGDRETRHSSMRVYGFRELTDLLRDAGFGDFEHYGSLESDTFHPGDRLYLVARRTP